MRKWESETRKRTEMANQGEAETDKFIDSNLRDGATDSNLICSKKYFSQFFMFDQ